MRIGQRRDTAQRTGERLLPALESQLERKQARLSAVSQLFDSLNYKSVLERGYALVRDGHGNPIRDPDAIADGQALTLEFASGTAEATGGRGQRTRPVRNPAKPVLEDQGALF